MSPDPQLRLWPPAAFHGVPRVRTTDPVTSRQAAERHKAGKLGPHLAFVIECVKAHKGWTAVELYEHFRWPDRHEWSRRLPEAERLGYVQKGKPRKCRVRDTLMVTWLPACKPAR